MPRDLGPVLSTHTDGRHTYRAGRAPDGLLTRRQLRAEGLSAAGLAAAGWLHYNPLHGTCPLFDRSAARPVRPLTDRQRENLARGRLLANTLPCAECSVVRVRWFPSWEGTAVCDGCLPARRERLAREAAERRQAAEHAHVLQLAADRRSAAAWARELITEADGVVPLPLDGPTALLPVVCDTETTSLGGYMVELAVVELDGTVLLDTLVDPQVPIPAEATEIHGITDDMVKGAPAFGQLLDRLSEILRGRPVLIWNAPFDTEVVDRELRRLFRADDLVRLPDGSGWDFAAMRRGRRQADGWMTDHLPGNLVSCAMRRHAAWRNAWDDYHQSYSWHRLDGGHRALGDCLAVIERLREMAATNTEQNGE